MQKSKRTIVVTGCNKGIGFGLVRHLSQDPAWHIIMACRNTKLAEEALNTLKTANPDADIEVAELDISSFESIDRFVQWAEAEKKQVDVLVNNAAVLFREWTVEAMEACFQTNFHGTAYLTERMLPLISHKGKIISVSSTRAQYPNVIVAGELKQRWADPSLTKEGLMSLVEEYKASVRENSTEQKGYLVNKVRFYFYPATKLALSTFVRIFGQLPEVVDRGVQVYNVHPGYIDTDMSQHKGTGTVEDGIDTLAYLIGLPFEFSKELQGQLFENRKVIPLDPPLEQNK